jgi:endonuclease/exonuclease/phosphatase family metal-dependent hydrolase
MDETALPQGRRKQIGQGGQESFVPISPERFADYVLVSSDVQVKVFRILDEEVSDHLPLLLALAKRQKQTRQKKQHNGK